MINTNKLTGAVMALALLAGAVLVGHAQTASNPTSTNGTTAIPPATPPVIVVAPVPPIAPGKFSQEKATVTAGGNGTITIVVNAMCTRPPLPLRKPLPLQNSDVTIFNEQAVTSTAAPSSLPPVNVPTCTLGTVYTVDLTNILVIGPEDRALNGLTLKKGESVLVYLVNSGSSRTPYALKVMGMGNNGMPPKENPSSSTPLCVIEKKVDDAGRVISVTNCKVVPPGLFRGNEGDGVMQLQKKLQEKNLLPGDSATGFFGPATEKAVKDLQSSKGLPSTGFFGAMTLEALLGEH